MSGVANVPSILRSHNKEEAFNLSAPRDAYHSSKKIDHSGLETSNIIDEKMSDMSFSYNLNEIIGSMDDKSELKIMKT